MDIIDLLDKEHREARELAQKLCDEEQDAGRRRDIFKELKAAVTSHARAEEAAVYEALKDLDEDEAQDMAQEGYVEHGLLDHLFAKMGRSTATLSPSWSAHAVVVKEMLEHHVEDEEKEMFGLLRRHFSDEERRELAESFERHKAKAKGRGKAPAGARRAQGA